MIYEKLTTQEKCEGNQRIEISCASRLNIIGVVRNVSDSSSQYLMKLKLVDHDFPGFHR